MAASSALNRHSNLPLPELKSEGSKWKNELSTALYRCITDIYTKLFTKSRTTEDSLTLHKTLGVEHPSFKKMK